MENEPQPCSNCGADTQQDRAAGLTYCAACGSGLREDPVPTGTVSAHSPDADDVADRSRWKQCFWLAFFLTPVAPFIAGMGATLLMRTFPDLDNQMGNLLVTFSAIGVFAVGVLSSSYCLLRIRDETLNRSETLAHMVLYAFGMVIAYGGILFAGCGVLSMFFR